MKLHRDNRWVSALMMVWAMGLITYATHLIYTQLELVTTTVGTVYTLTIGILAAATGFFLKVRGIEEDDSK